MKRSLFLILFLFVQGGWAADWTWQEVGPEGGSMLDISINPNGSSVISASAWCDAYLNQGGPWQRVLPQGPSGGGNYMSFLLPDTAIFVQKENAELFRSVNGGLNWSYVRGFSDEVLAVSEVKSRVAYIVAKDWANSVDSLYRTTDAGATWDTLGVLPLYFEGQVAVTSFLDTLIFIGGWAQDTVFVLKSDDGGQSWNTVVGFESPGEGEVNDLEWDESRKTLWTCFDAGPPHAASLPPVHLYCDSLGFATFLDELKTAGIYIVNDIEFLPQDTVLAGGLLGIYRVLRTPEWDSVWVDSWVDSSTVVNDIDLEGGAVWAASEAGCLSSTDGGSAWQYENSGLDAVTILSHTQLSELVNGTLYMGSMGGFMFGPLYRSTSEGATWQWLEDGPKLSMSAELFRGNPDVAYVHGLWLTSGYTYHSIARSLDGGLSWTWMNSFPVDSAFQEMMTSDVWVSPSDQDILLRPRAYAFQLYPGPVLRSTDGGVSWNQVLADSVLWLAGGDTVFASWDSTWVSYDAGATWNLFTELGGWIDWDETHEYLYLVTTEDSFNLYRYDLAGDSTHIFGPFTSLFGWSTLSVSPLGHIYLSWIDQTFVPQMARSTDLGATWEIDTLDFLCTAVRACSTAVIASEIGRGLRRSTDAIGVEETSTTASPMISFMVSPNPLINSTTIKYSLAEAGKVRVAIYDVTGRLVRVIEEGRKQRGAYQASWDGKNVTGSRVSSGVYFIRLEPENQEAKTVSLVKLSS